MHQEQVDLSALHMDIHKRHMDRRIGYETILRVTVTNRNRRIGYRHADDIEDQYAKVAEKLDHLHELMVSSSKVRHNILRPK